MSGPILPSPQHLVHLHFIPKPLPGQPCVICRGDDPDFGCERCGVPFHGDCHYASAASAKEWARISAAALAGDETALNQFIMLCSGCRS